MATTGTVFQMMESLVPRGALTRPTARAASEFWRRVMGETEEARRTAEQESQEEETTVAAANECEEHQSVTATATTIFNTNQQADAFAREMRLRDNHGQSLRTSAWEGAMMMASSTPPTPPSLTLGINDAPDLSVPSAPGSTDYIYLPQ